MSTGQLKEGEGYDVDFDYQSIETEKFDAKPTYKKFLGYRPRVAVIGDMIVGIENRQNEARAETKLALAMPCEEKEAQRATTTATLTFVSTSNHQLLQEG